MPAAANPEQSPPGRGLILGIEASNPTTGSGPGPGDGAGSAGVALARREGRGLVILGTEPIGAGREGDDVVWATDRLCARLGVVPVELGRIAVSIGPGGYTAVRMAVAAAKMIALGAGAECVGVPTAMVVALAARERAGGAAFEVALAGKGDSGWLTRFAPGWTGVGDGVPEGRLVSAAEAAGPGFWDGVGLLVGDAHVPAGLREGAEAGGVRVVDPVLDAAWCARAGAELVASDPARVNPLYPREPDAVRLWRERKGT
ncbi:MAG TPA: hypothetical protein VD963_09745 [Phycisphaerales bacterium]|nr:hypothetical protein [Phycisphaerales bacterium]